VTLVERLVEAVVQELPRKDFYKLSEVCQYTDTQPYVLRFWETEFPQLQPGKSASGQRMYRRRDVDVVRRIKELLHDEEYTLDRARKLLAQELSGGKRLKVRARRQETVEPAPERPAPRVESTVATPRKRIPEPEPTPVVRVEGVARERYEHAVDEIDHLRLALKEAEKNLRRAESDTEEAQATAEQERERAEKAVGHLERLHEILS